MPFSSAPLKRNMTVCLVGTALRDRTSNTSRATATLTPLSLAPEIKFQLKLEYLLNFRMYKPGLP